MRHGQLLLHGVSSLLEKEYSEANFTQELLKLFAERANLTETLGVSAKAADLMQASYQAVMEDKVYELDSTGSGFIFIAGSFVLSYLLTLLCLCCLCCLVSCWAGSGLLQTGEQVASQMETEQIKQRAVYEKKKAFVLWLYKKKFGNDQAAAMETCISQVADKGAGLLRKAGLDVETLQDQLHGMKEAKPRTQMQKVSPWC